MSVADSEESTPPCTRLCMDHGIRFDLEIGVSAETRIQLLMQQDNQDCADHTLSIYGDLSSGSPASVTDLVLVLINSKGSSTYINSLQTIDLFYEAHPEYPDVLDI